MATGYADDVYVYLNKEERNGDGITWLKIQLEDGRTGYVSKKVAVIQ